MNVIKKIINLRDFTEKFGKNEPHIMSDDASGSTSYGTIPYNVKVDEVLEQYSAIPTYEANGGRAVKYGTIARLYTWLKKFIIESVYYKQEKWRSSVTWSETGSTLEYNGKLDIFSGVTAVLAELPNEPDEDDCGEIFCINHSADTFDKFFSGSTESAIQFLTYVETVIFNGDYETADPFVEIPVLFDRDIDDLGYEYICWPEIDDNFIPIEVLIEEGRVDEFRYYKSGEYIRYNGRIYKYIGLGVDNLDYYMNSQNWELCEENDEEGSDEFYYTESKLKTLLRKKTTVDKELNVVGFVYNYDTMKAELQYSIGSPFNVVYDGNVGTYRYDIMSSITCTNSDGSVLDYENLTPTDIGKIGKIKFNYVIGNILDDVNSDVTTDYETGGGVSYEEEYDYEVKICQFDDGSISAAIPYVDIDYTTGFIPEWGNSGVTYAKINMANTGEGKISINHLIRYDTLIGLTDLKFKNEEIKIDRGASASYEAFNVIGEVNTLDDIEKYHDDWFRIKGKND